MRAFVYVGLFAAFILGGYMLLSRGCVYEGEEPPPVVAPPADEPPPPDWAPGPLDSLPPFDAPPDSVPPPHPDRPRGEGKGPPKEPK